jgi:hypothetical protein
LPAGVLMTSYEEPQNRRLKDFFKVLSLSLARDGLPYISTMEARKVRMVIDVTVMPGTGNCSCFVLSTSLLDCSTAQLQVAICCKYPR